MMATNDTRTASDRAALFNPVSLQKGRPTPDAMTLKHRVVLAPLTRNRATEPGLCPHAAQVEYYSQRASPGGLLISEAVNISPEAVGYTSTPGIWTEEQVAAWRLVTDAVHAKGGRIFCQLWHTGRVSQPSFGTHPLLRASGRSLPSVSASATAIVHPRTGKPGKTVTYDGVEATAVPRALHTAEIAVRLREDYREAAANAIRAGFDGCELHAAHGYLVDQFIQDGVNTGRTDQYGGSVPNRCRLLFELAEAISAEIGSHRLAVRLSPTTIDPTTGIQTQYYYGTTCTDPDDVYAHAVSGLNGFNLAYLLLTEPRWSGRFDGDVTKDKGFTMPLTNAKYRKLYTGTLIAAGGFTPATAAAAVSDGIYDLIAFGRWFIANPDLPERLRTGAQLNVYNRDTFYLPTITGGGSEGYTDYPDLAGSVGVPGKYALMDQAAVGTSLPSKL